MREVVPEQTTGIPTRVQGDATMLSLAAFTATVERIQRPRSVIVRGMIGDAEYKPLILTQNAFHDAWRATQRGDAPWDGGG